MKTTKEESGSKFVDAMESTRLMMEGLKKDGTLKPAPPGELSEPCGPDEEPELKPGRTKVMPSRLTGKVIDWKGRFGWLQPDQPLTHPLAAKHGGKLYLGQEDVEADIEVGSHVSFFVYADKTGLGAMACKPAAPGVQKTVFKQPTFQQPTFPQQTTFQQRASAPFPQYGGNNAGGGRPAPGQAGYKGPRQRVCENVVSGVIQNWKGSFGWIEPTEAIAHPLFRGKIYVHRSDIQTQEPVDIGQTVEFYVYADTDGLGAEKCMVLPEGSTPGFANNAAPRGSVMEGIAAKAPARWNSQAPSKGKGKGRRERLTGTVPTTGEVVEWKFGAGWLHPHEEVEHPKRSPDGRVYVARADIVGATELTVGELVQFHIFVDNTGVGAEEVTPF